MNQPQVFVFEPSPALFEILRDSLSSCAADVVFTSEKARLLQLLQSRQPDVVVLGPGSIRREHNLDCAREVKAMRPSASLLLVASESSEELAIAALRAGIREYVKFPFTKEDLLGAIERCSSRPQTRMNSCLGRSSFAEKIIGESCAMQEIRSSIARVAASDSNVLITGETGTGKELLAEAVHGRSPRRDKPLIAINCAAIPDTLLESELFGYNKGAFTGADSNCEGKLKAADRGTVFLDEIGDMSAYGQAKILRVLESKEIQRLGSNRGIPLDVRVIAATNQNLEQLSRENKFRKDLFFRLNVARIHLPALRDHKEDLLLLVEYYIERFNRQFGARVQRISEEAMDCLLVYDWPGNVRELKNLLESIFVSRNSETICLADLPLPMRLRCNELRSLTGDDRERLLWALSATNWNKSKAADKLQWSRMTLYRKMARYNISQARRIA
jgi:DNA-binding NtrC family response regulator